MGVYMREGIGSGGGAVGGDGAGPKITCKEKARTSASMRGFMLFGGRVVVPFSAPVNAHSFLYVSILSIVFAHQLLLAFRVPPRRPRKTELIVFPGPRADTDKHDPLGIDFCRRPLRGRPLHCHLSPPSRRLWHIIIYICVIPAVATGGRVPPALGQRRALPAITTGV